MVLFALFLPAAASSAETKEKDGHWRAEWISEKGPAIASVNGNIMHGDRLSVWVSGPACDMARMTFSSYSLIQDSGFLALEGKTIKVRFNGTVQDAQVLSAKPFLMGYKAHFNLGVEPLEKVKQRLAQAKILSAEILNQEKFFDTPQNNWRVAGLNAALDDARALCKKNTIVKDEEEDGCKSLVNAQAWLTALRTNIEEKYVSFLKYCLADNTDVPKKIDTMMVAVFQEMDSVIASLEKKPKDIAAFIKNTLQIAAEAGYAPAQHNFAALHNVDPQSPQASLFPVDEAAFITWTRKAAAQKEPRALFNLAIRMIPDENQVLPPDLPTAYILLRRIADDMAKDNKLRQFFGSLIDEQLGIVRGQLGPEKTAQAEARRASFDFRSLER